MIQDFLHFGWELCTGVFFVAYCDFAGFGQKIQSGDYTLTRAMTIGEIASSQASTATYYTLNGIQVAKPTQPGIYMMKTGETVRKVVIQ